METGFAPTNGASIYYEIVGSGQPLVMIHGMGLNCFMWDEQFHAFADKYKVIRYDLRGFGRSSLPGADNYAHHTDLHTLLQYFGIQKANLMGLSMGGRVAIDFVLTYPEAVLSLVLVDSVIHGHKNKYFSNDAVAAAAKKSPEAANQAWLAHELFAPARRKPAVAEQLTKIISTYSGWHWVNKNPWIPIDPPAIQQLHKITAPTLIIVGEEDLPDFLDMSNILHEQIADSKKVVMAGVGHMSNMEDPETFNGLAREFLL
jgi:3-oxoadipate enol-lactonase